MAKDKESLYQCILLKPHLKIVVFIILYFLKLKAACRSKSFACTAHIIIHLGC